MFAGGTNGLVTVHLTLTLHSLQDARPGPHNTCWLLLGSIHDDQLLFSHSLSLDSCSFPYHVQASSVSLPTTEQPLRIVAALMPPYVVGGDVIEVASLSATELAASQGMPKLEDIKERETEARENDCGGPNSTTDNMQGLWLVGEHSRVGLEEFVAAPLCQSTSSGNQKATQTQTLAHLQLGTGTNRSQQVPPLVNTSAPSVGIGIHVGLSVHHRTSWARTKLGEGRPERSAVPADDLWPRDQGTVKHFAGSVLQDTDIHADKGNAMQGECASTGKHCAAQHASASRITALLNVHEVLIVVTLPNICHVLWSRR
jgi:hypothetical protein